MKITLIVLLLMGLAAQDPAADPLEDNVTFRLTFEGTLKPEKSAARSGPLVAFLSTADKPDWVKVEQETLDAKHYVDGLRGKGLTNADPRTFLPEIQYPVEGHLKSKSGTILWWMKFSRPAPKGGGGGAMFATHGGSLFCALEATRPAPHPPRGRSRQWRCSLGRRGEGRGWRCSRIAIRRHGVL